MYLQVKVRFLGWYRFSDDHCIANLFAQRASGRMMKIRQHLMKLYKVVELNCLLLRTTLYNRNLFLAVV